MVFLLTSKRMNKDRSDIKENIINPSTKCRKRYHLWPLGVLFMIYAVIRAIRLGASEFGDATLYAAFFENVFQNTGGGHTPLVHIMHNLFFALFGVHNYSFRLFPFILSLFSFVFVYLIAKRYFSRNTAFIALFMLTFLPWHVFSSTSANVPWEQLSFFVLSGLYFLLRYTETENWRYAGYSATLISLAVLAYESAVIFLGVVFFVEFIRKRKFFKAVKLASFYFLFVIAGLIIFFIIDYIFRDFIDVTAVFMGSVMTNATGYIGIGLKDIIFKVPFGFLPILFWAGPMIVIIIILYVLKHIKTITKPVPRSYLLTFLLTFFIFYSLIIPIINGYREKYLAVLIPVIVILTADYIITFFVGLKLRPTRYQLIIICLISAILLGISIAIMMGLNTERNIISINRLDLLIAHSSSFPPDWDFPLSNGADNNAGMLINMKVVFFSYIAFIGIISYVAFFFWSRKIIDTKPYNAIIASLFLIALIIGLGFNVFILNEYLFHPTSPDYEKVGTEIQDYFLKNTLEKPIYNIGFSNYRYYLTKKYCTDIWQSDCQGLKQFDPLEKDPDKIDTFAQQLHDEGGTVIFIDVRLIDREGKLFNLLESCTTLKEFSDKGVLLGKIYDCSNLKQ
ncbi:hypothetical protein COV93_06200 [Candidatus Woesearchaeota archaeon CG11_big_fil_rev_8_21_14_0_20_43_8]|nr:MAG: hypothetical protein COV93_06200 [Candidatus Woesearchaeota archaeon CG11_big_fil_rev_8_21_14_0_20_43_8]